MATMAFCRASRWLDLRRVPLLPALLYAFNRIVFSAVVPPQAMLGQGVRLGYRGLGTVTHPDARIGNCVLIGHGVTIGGRSEPDGVPVIDADVHIGAGAKLLGPIHIGEGVRIGANAVVLCDVPAGATAVGVPARIVTAHEPHKLPSVARAVPG